MAVLWTDDLRRSWPVRYGAAALLACVALLVRLPFHQALENKIPYLTFFFAVLISAAFGGFGPGILATILGTLLASRFVTAGAGLFGLVDPADPSGAARFLAIAVATSYVCGELVKSNERARDAERAERTSRLLVQQTLAGIADAVISTDTAGRIQLMNAAAEKLTGCSSARAAGRPIASILRLGAPPQFNELVEAVLRTRAGVTLPLEATIARQPAPIHVEGNASPITDEHGKVMGVVVTFRDISDRRQSEKQLAQQADELRRSNRELEEFAYVVSHDLQEPLRMVNTYSELLLRQLGPQRADHLDQLAGVIRDGIDRMNRLIRDLLAYSRVAHETLEAAPTDPQTSIDEALASCRPLIGEAGADIVVGHLPAVLAHEGPLTQVFQNLISNAIKYRKSDAHPHVSIDAREDNGQVIFSVADDGIGFDQNYANRIFGLFKRLHSEEYPGTGVGLAITKKIVERYNGRIWAEAAPGRGATFFFTLPAARRNSE